MTTALGQRQAALEIANRTRTLRASLKRNIAAQTRPSAVGLVCAVLEDNPPETRTMYLADLIGSIPQCGRRRTFEFMRQANVAWSRRVGDLTVREWVAISDALRTWV